MFVLSSLVAEVGYSVEQHEFKPQPKRLILSVQYCFLYVVIFIFHQLKSLDIEMGQEIKTSHCLKKIENFL